MKKNTIISACVSLLFLVSCDYNEKNFPGFDELTNPKDVQTVMMDLVDADYKTIAGLNANKELALSKDTEGKTFAAALEAVSKNKYFTEDAQALWYLPAFINEKQPYLSDGSKVTINYNNYENLPEYLKDFNSISNYDLTTADYKNVWGDAISASFLSPSTVKQIPALLKGAVPMPADGAMRLVNYAYSETEPSTGGGSGEVPEPKPTYINIADVITNDLKVTNSAVYRYELSSNSWKEYKTNGVAINILQPADYAEMGNTFVSKPIEILPIYLKQARPYAKKDDKAVVVYYSKNNKTIAADEYAFDGANWTQTIVSTPSTIVFLKTQGTWTEAKVYYACTFLNNDAGGFVIQDVKLGELKKVWSIDAKLGWKASAFSGGNKEAESWIISPDIDLKKSVAPVLKFDIAINYLNGAEATKYFSTLVSTNYTDNVTTATWTELTIKDLPKGNSWDYTSITAVDLSVYKGQTIRIAFRYKSDLTTTNTTEIKNMSVQE